jgi:putative methyltransferase (TIGR04325 family)
VLRSTRELIRRARGALRPVWSGVYPHYRDVPAKGPGFHGRYWSDQTRARTEAEMRAAAVPGRHDPLQALCVRVADERGRVRVLDFGGGMGIGYIRARRSVPKEAALAFTVVETEEVCAEGRQVHAGNSEIEFRSSIPERLDLDIVHVESALQYLPDHREVVRALTALRARYVLLVELTAGDVPTFASAQLNVPGSVIPYWFLNAHELIELFRASGYKLVSDRPSSRALVGLDVPPRYRLERGRDLLFELAGQPGRSGSSQR